MPDEVKGIAVLSAPAQDGSRRLAVWCVPAQGDPFRSVLPVVPEAAPRPPGQCWVYRKQDGGILTVRPSVKVSTTRPEGAKSVEVEVFHNPYNWSIPFVEAPASAEDEAYGLQALHTQLLREKFPELVPS